MKRGEMLDRAFEREAPWDMVIVGGGATGVGIAVDAAARGYDVLLLERSDFGKGTSSRSTKLVHGGVRYLQQGNVSLVMEALQERGILRQNAPHLVHDLRFIVPSYDWWDSPFYGIGLKVYDLLARKYSFGPSRILSREDTLEAIPTLEREGLRGGVQYYDGQFDDARLLINLVQTAAREGATLVNYAEVASLLKDAQGLVHGVAVRDVHSGKETEVFAKVVINATGPFADELRALDAPGAEPMIAPSQGVHLVLPRSFLPKDNAIMVPHTRDGRVMFAIPWHDRTLIGTTDTPVAAAAIEPVAQREEVDFLLETAAQYLDKDPTEADVASVFAGIRPLVKAGGDGNTAALSRDHTIHISDSGLVTIAGGKWTTYRNMAEDCVDQAATVAGLAEQPCVTRALHIHGYHVQPESFGDLACYGSDAPALEDLMRGDAALGERLHERLPIRAGQVTWAVRFELALSVDDVLARRTRALFLDARAAIEMAPRVAELMAAELGRDRAWQEREVLSFTEIASHYHL